MKWIPTICVLTLTIGTIGVLISADSGTIRNTTPNKLVIEAQLKDGSSKRYVLGGMQSALEPESFDDIVALEVEQIEPDGSRSKHTFTTFYYDGMNKQEKLGEQEDDLIFAQHGAYPLHVMSKTS